MRCAAALLLCACGLPGGDVLLKTPVVRFTTCEDALASAQVGDACSGITTCQRKLEPCCTDVLECNGLVTSFKHDCSDCSPCTDDDACAAQTVCLGGLCEPCPRINETCEKCPDGFEPLLRNGCSFCDCGPPSTCTGSGCVAGAFCSERCTGSTCCVQHYRQPTCPMTPNPTGCFADCGTVTCAGGCFATGCTCPGGVWTCDAKCAPGTEVFTSRCNYP